MGDVTEARAAWSGRVSREVGLLVCCHSSLQPSFNVPSSKHNGQSQTLSNILPPSKGPMPLLFVLMSAGPVSVIGFVSWANGRLGVGGGGERDDEVRWVPLWHNLVLVSYHSVSISHKHVCFCLLSSSWNWIEFYFRLHCKRNDRLHTLITNMRSIQGGYAVVYLLCTTRGPLWRLYLGSTAGFLFFNQLSSLGWIYNPIQHRPDNLSAFI